MGRRTIAAALATALAALIVACGGSPANPGPVTPPPTGGGGGGQSGPNSPPVINSIDVSSERTEVDTDVTVTAHVTDAETPADQLKYEWKADGGTFSGEGASVKWRAPKDIETPKDYTLALTVTETYGTPNASGERPTNVVNGMSPAIRVHNSPKELVDMGMAFLTDFANSKISSSVCLRDFTDSCKGKQDEKSDIDWNRDHDTILAHTLKLTDLRIHSDQLGADIAIACTFTARVDKCEPTDTSCRVGSVGTADGTCTLTGKYEQKRWWLCDSHFTGRASAMFKAFLR